MSARHRMHPMIMLFWVIGVQFVACGMMPATPGQRHEAANAIPTSTHIPHGTPATRRSSPTPTVPAAQPGSNNEAFVIRAIARTNLYRQQNGCPALHENAKLDQAAFGHSQDMAINHYFAHNSPRGVTPWDRIHAAGYQFSEAAENIAAGYATPEAVIDAFFDEQPPNDGHRLNILNCSLEDVGIGYYFLASAPYRYYWTQDFATPQG